MEVAAQLPANAETAPPTPPTTTLQTTPSADDWDEDDDVWRTETVLLGDGCAVSVPTGTRVVRLPSRYAGTYTALLLFAPRAIETRHTEVRTACSRGDGGPAAAYLAAPPGTRSARFLLRHDEFAYEESINGCATAFSHLPRSVPHLGWPNAVCVSDGAEGVRRWFAGLTWVAALVTVYDANGMAFASGDPRRRAELASLAAAVALLPDGRHAVVPGAYASSSVTFDVDRDTQEILSDDSVMPLLPAWHVYCAARQKVLSGGFNWPGWRSWHIDRDAACTADAMDRSMAAPAGAFAQLVDGLPPAEAAAVRDALLPHVALLTARRLAAPRIRRAWLRYDGAPHGPRARFLRDLERGWRPAPRTPGPADAHRSGPEACRSALDAMRLFSDEDAYYAYVDDRRERLRYTLAGRASAAERVRLRLAALTELPPPPPPADCDAFW